MRTIHFASSGTAHVEPACGAWGSMDTDWTSDEDGVTCTGCQVALRGVGPGPAPPGGLGGRAPRGERP